MRTGLTESRFPFVARLGSTSRRELGALVPSRFRPKARLLRRGDPVQGMYFVVDGSLRVYYLTPEGREATLYRVEPGGTCVLALTSTFSEEPYPAWVDAGSDGGAFVRVPSELCRRLIAVEASFRDFVFATLSGRIFELMRTLEEAGTLQIEQRLARYLLRHASKSRSVRASQAGIAAELGTAREVVFRALRSLVARRAIETGRMRIDIVDAAELRRIGEHRGELPA